MTPQPSPYQSLKLRLAEVLPVDRDILHIGIGAVQVLAALAAWRMTRRTRPFVIALLAACALGVGMEALDRQDDLRTLGIWRWQHSASDVLRTILAPTIGLVIAARVRLARRG